MSFSVKSYLLADLLTIKYGKNQKKVQDDTNGLYPIYGTGGLMGYSTQFLYDKPSILIGRKGSISKVKYVDHPFWTVDTLFYTEVNENLVLPKFMFYKMSLIDFLFYNEGTTIPSLRTETLKQIEFNIPPLNEQKVITNILSTLDEKIELNNQINKTLEIMAGEIFKQWFVDFEFPNEDGEPYQSSGGEMVESELGMIPKGWEVKSIDDLVELIIDYRGKTPKKLGSDWSEKGIIALSAKSIKNGRLVNLEKANRVDEELYSIWMKDELKYGDILLTSEAPLGELYFLATNDKYCLSQRLFAIRADKKQIIPEVLYMYLKTPQVMENLLNRATGTTVTGIRQSELRKVSIIKPDNKIQMKFQDMIINILRKVNVAEKENEKLSLLRNFLLPKLMSGEIRVPLDLEGEAS